MGGFSPVSPMCLCVWCIYGVFMPTCAEAAVVANRLSVLLSALLVETGSLPTWNSLID